MRKKRDIVAMTEEEIVLRKEQKTIEDLYGTFLNKDTNQLSAAQRTIVQRWKQLATLIADLSLPVSLHTVPFHFKRTFAEVRI